MEEKRPVKVLKSSKYGSRERYVEVIKVATFSKEDYAKIERIMEERGYCKFAHFVRTELLALGEKSNSGVVPVRRTAAPKNADTLKALDNLLKAFKRIGTNYNQFVRNTLYLSKFTTKLGTPVITSKQVIEATNKLSALTDELTWAVKTTRDFIISRETPQTENSPERADFPQGE